MSKLIKQRYELQWCAGCPFLGECNECERTGDYVTDTSVIPDFCPLPDYEEVEVLHVVDKTDSGNDGFEITTMIDGGKAQFDIDYYDDRRRESTSLTIQEVRSLLAGMEQLEKEGEK